MVVKAFSNSFLFESIIASIPHIMKVFPSSDISVIWINIWDFQKGSKDKTLINCVILLQLEGLLYILESLSITIASTGNILHMLARLLYVKSIYSKDISLWQCCHFKIHNISLFPMTAILFTTHSYNGDTIRYPVFYNRNTPIELGLL